MKISGWIAHKSLNKPTFVRFSRHRLVFALRGFTVHIRRGPWRFDWQGDDTKNFGRRSE